MPCYDYSCIDCEQIFTIKKSMTDDNKPQCPECKGTNVARVWGSVNLGGMSKGGGSGSSGCSSCSGGSCSICK